MTAKETELIKKRIELLKDWVNIENARIGVAERGKLLDTTNYQLNLNQTELAYQMARSHHITMAEAEKNIRIKDGYTIRQVEGGWA